MEKVISDSEFSVDSLEDFRTDSRGINPHKRDNTRLASTKSGNSDNTVRNKEPLGRKTKVEETKTFKDKSIALSESQVNSILNKEDKLRLSSKGSDIYNSCYFISQAPRSQSARVPSKIQRVSRRQSVCFEIPESQRIRHRSVSYLEQFKKRHGGTIEIGLATSTTKPSEVPSLSCVSGTTIVTSSVNKTDSSEFEFYEDLIINEDRNVLNSMREENKQKFKVIPVEKKGVSKQRKVQSNIHECIKPNRDLRNCVQDHFDKRKALEKREEYSKKVQLRNQIKANRQKEIDKAIKFKDSPFKSHPCEQEHFLCQSRELPLILNSNDVGVVPFLMNQLDISGSTRSGSSTRKTMTKPVKKKTKNQKSTSTEVCKLSMLQKRHESEKTVVDSIRNNFTNR